MLDAGVAGAGDRCGVLAVTVLTSLDGTALAAAWGRDGGRTGGGAVDVRAEVLRLSGIAERAGAHGVVCGGREAAAVSARFGAGLHILVPGIRPAGVAADDQARAVSPPEAAAAGASYLVIGRAVTASPDPAAALADIRRALALA
jgi:orotidine-5'-phosphate decarboxylase